MSSDETFFRPARSVDIIRALTEALKSEEEDLTGRTARDYRAGKTVREDTERRIIEALARTLREAGFLPALEMLQETRSLDPEVLLADVLEWHVHRWDQFAMGQLGIGMPVRASRHMALAYLRLVTVDIAFRTAAICALAGIPFPDNQPPNWARNDGRSSYLHRLMQRVGGRRLSMKGQHSLVSELDVSPQTVDAWFYQGARPSNAHLAAIAALLAEYLESEDAGTLASNLRRHYALCDIASMLADQIGWDATEDVASALVRFSSRLVSGLWTPHRDLSTEDVGQKLQIAVAGVRGPNLDPEVQWLLEREEDDGWRGDLLTAVYKDWARWLYDVTTEIGVSEEAARIARREYQQEVTPEAQDWMAEYILARARFNVGTTNPVGSPWDGEIDSPHAIASRFYDVALDRAQAGLLDQAIASMRQAVELEPEVAWYRVSLAELLADAGKLQAAFDECWIADALAPDWEQPRVFIGMFLNNAGRFKEAREHLLATADHLGRHTLNLSLNLGMAYLETGEPALALAELEVVIKERPEAGMAWDMAAICCFQMGDHVEGRRMAKRAKQLGFGVAHAAAASGAFRRDRGPSAKRTG